MVLGQNFGPGDNCNKVETRAIKDRWARPVETGMVKLLKSGNPAQMVNPNKLWCLNTDCQC